jgi:tetratricopeptide (TPR) repeat protein
MVLHKPLKRPTFRERLRGMNFRLSVLLLGTTLIMVTSRPSGAQSGSEPGNESRNTTSTSTQSPPLDPTNEAIKAFKEAKGFYRSGKYLEALESFQKAYKLKATPAILYNIARCYEKLSQLKDAIKTYEDYARLTSDPRDKAEAFDKVEGLKRKIAEDDNSPAAKYRANISNGKAAYKKGDYESAISAFKEAYDIKASSGALYNIAKSYERMGRFEEALEYLQQYLQEDPNATDRANIEDNIRRLRRSIRDRFQELSVSSDPPGADIYLDDRTTGLQGQTNYRMKAQPGPHTLYLDLNGYEPYKTDFVMPDDKPLALEFKLKKLTKVGFVKISVNVDGARIFVDGAIVGLSPFRDPKALPAGKHQLTLEASAYPRYTKSFIVARGKTNTLKIKLEKYIEPVKGETLAKWGRSFLMLGIIGGGLGFGGPFLYQKYFLQRPLYDALGPAEVTGDNFWRGQVTADKMPIGEGGFTDSFQENKEAKLLQQIQLGSAIGGGVFIAAGITFYMVKWFRPEDQVHIIAQAPESSAPSPTTVSLSSIGYIPSTDGGHFALSGSF